MGALDRDGEKIGARVSELVSSGGMMHDGLKLAVGCMRFGLTLPKGWDWLGFGSVDPLCHQDVV